MISFERCKGLNFYFFIFWLKFHFIFLFFQIVRYRIRNRGVITTIPREKNDFLFRYVGRVIPEGSEQPKKTEYAIYFRHNNKKYVCVADDEDGSLGRLCNHSLSRRNMKPNVIDGDDGPIIYFYATSDLNANEELLWNYNDRTAPEEDRIWLTS